MAVFSMRKAAATPAADTGTVTFLSALAATTRALRVQEFGASGHGTASGFNNFRVAPGDAGTGALTNLTPFPLQPMATAVAGFTAGTTYATAIPTVNTNAGIDWGVNNNGGVYRWLAKTNFELYAAQATAGYQSINWKCVSTSGTANVSGYMFFEEL
jgi:hypothetical protein